MRVSFAALPFIGGIIIAVGFLCVVQAQDAPIIITPADSIGDSTQVYLNRVNVAEVTLTNTARARTGNLTRKGERDALLAYWQAKASYHSAQAQFCAYVGDRSAAFAARRLRDEALAKSYAYLPSQQFKVEHTKLRLDTQG